MILETLKRGPVNKHSFSEDTFPSALEYEVSREELEGLADCCKIRVGELLFHKPEYQCDASCGEIDSSKMQKQLEDMKAGVLCFFYGTTPVYFVIKGIDTVLNPETLEYINPLDDISKIIEIMQTRRSRNQTRRSRNRTVGESSIPQEPTLSIQLRRDDDPDADYLRYVHNAFERLGAEYISERFQDIRKTAIRYGFDGQLTVETEHSFLKKPKNYTTALCAMMMTFDRYADLNRSIAALYSMIGIFGKYANINAAELEIREMITPQHEEQINERLAQIGRLNFDKVADIYRIVTKDLFNKSRTIWHPRTLEPKYES